MSRRLPSSSDVALSDFQLSYYPLTPTRISDRDHGTPPISRSMLRQPRGLPPSRRASTLLYVAVAQADFSTAQKSGSWPRVSLGGSLPRTVASTWLSITDKLRLRIHDVILLKANRLLCMWTLHSSIHPALDTNTPLHAILVALHVMIIPATVSILVAGPCALASRRRQRRTYVLRG